MTDLAVGLDRGRAAGPSRPDPFCSQRTYVKLDLSEEDKERYDKIYLAKDAKVRQRWLANPADQSQPVYRLTHEELDKLVPLVDPEGAKPCERCGTMRRMSQFYRSKNNPDGYSSICRHCTSKRAGEKPGPDERNGDASQHAASDATRDEGKPDDLKRCSKCKQIRAKVYFYRHAGMLDGYSPSCVDCDRERRQRSRHLCRLRREAAIARANGGDGRS